MLALTSHKSHRFFSNSLHMHYTQDSSHNNWGNTVVKNKMPEHIAKISKQVKDNLDETMPSRFNRDFSIGTYIKLLTPAMIYEHAKNMSESTNPQVKDLALCLFFKAAKKGNLEALNIIGSLILNNAPELNLDRDCDQKIGLKFLKESAKHGNTEALMQLGHYYLKVKQDFKKAEEYYLSAHDKGHQNAFRHALFVREDILKAVDPKKAALTLTLVRTSNLE